MPTYRNPTNHSLTAEDAQGASLIVPGGEIVRTLHLLPSPWVRVSDEPNLSLGERVTLAFSGPERRSVEGCLEAQTIQVSADIPVLIRANTDSAPARRLIPGDVLRLDNPGIIERLLVDAEEAGTAQVGLNPAWAPGLDMARTTEARITSLGMDWLPTGLSTALAGERNQAATDGTDHQVTAGEWSYALVTGTAETLISDRPALLGGIQQTGAPTSATLTVRDAAAANSGAAGFALVFGTAIPSPPIKFDGLATATGLTVQPTAGSYLVWWRVR